MLRRSWSIATISIFVLIVAYYAHEILELFAGYRRLHLSYPFYFVESIDKLGGALLCIISVWLLYRGSLRSVLERLGLSGNSLRALAFGIAASLPMLLGFALNFRLNPHLEFLPLLFRDLFSPLVEEIEYRGFGVLQLQRGTGWPFWAVVWPSAIAFGYGHVEQGQSRLEMLGLFLVTGLGGVVLAWLAYRWQNLWVAVALHICMNLWWDLFSVSNNAIGGWFSFALQTLAIVMAIVGTMYVTKPPTRNLATHLADGAQVERP
jgi:membrane protease YdiL (CAAX protease family)